MKVLIACEYSGRVRDAFLRRGHDAVSCDLLPTDVPGPHYIGDVFDIIGNGWDLMIAHPPCTFLCSSGLHWNGRTPGRSEKTEQALEFVARLMNAPVARKCIENPRGCISTRIVRMKYEVGLGFSGPVADGDQYRILPVTTRSGLKADQEIQPWQFGADASKATALWLQDLPKLVPTDIIAPRIVDGKKRWGNQTNSGQNNLGPSPDRWKIRSETYIGIAEAMAEQWGNLI